MCDSLRAGGKRIYPAVPHMETAGGGGWNGGGA